MDIKKLTEETILKSMTPEQQKAVLESVMASVQESKKVRSQKVAENVDLVMQALKKIEAQMLARVNQAANIAETAAKNVKDGKDGRDGKDGKDGKQGAIGPKGADGRDGVNGKDGKDGRDGIDGVSVVNAFLDFDNSLVIELSNGKQINVGGILADDAAEKVRVVANGGGTSQGVLDAIAALQTAIATLIPSQTGNAGKFLTTNGSVLSWATSGGGLSYQETWNASTNSPSLSSGVGINGYYYVVATAGSTNLDGITDWQIGDWVIFNGTVWQKIDQSNLVTSVAGRTGAITLSNSDVSGSAASGANSDITSLSGITGAIGTADYVAFDTTYATTLGVGQLGWDGNNTLGLGMYGGNVVQRIGEDTFFYVKASSAITKGQVCMFTGAVGASGVVTAAPATGVTNGQYIMGIAAESISTNGFGLVQCFGTLRSVNTTGFSDGDIVYYDSAVTGGFTKTYPTSGPIITVAAVVNGGSSGGGVLQIRVSVTQRITASTGISVSQNGTGTTITNSAPDQTVVLTAGTGIATSGTYPNFTITNSAPDQTVSLTQGGTTTITGTYPNFTISSADQYSGTVTSVGGTGTVSGLSLSGTVTSSGSLTLGGTLDLSNVTGNAIVSKGLYAKTAMDGTYSDGIVVDYTTGMGRISVGASDGLTVYNGGVASSPLLSITSAGNIGIGTDTPSYKLHVATTGTDYPLLIQNTGTAASDDAILRIATSSTGTTSTIAGIFFGDADSNSVGQLRYNHSNNSMVFYTDSTAQLTLSNTGGVTISRDAVTSPASTDGNVFSGTYTPTQVSTNTNVASVTYSACQYMRVGNTVTVSGAITIDPTTAATNTVVLCSVPIASNFSSSRNLGGTGASTSVVGYAAQTFVALADTTNDCVEIRLNPASASAVAYAFSFTYLVQ